MLRIRPWRAAALAYAALLVGAATPAAGAGLSITADPPLTPGFRGQVSDYAVRCSAAEPVRFTVDAPPGVSVRVDDARPHTGAFTKKVALRNGQAASIVVRAHGRRRRHHVRCLPPGFPRWTFTRDAPPQAEWYLFAPAGHPKREVPWSHYVTIMDGHGVPVWWSYRVQYPFHAELLPNGDLAWARWFGEPFGQRPDTGWEIHHLGGGLVGTLRTVGSPTDLHELRPLDDGHFLLDTYRLRRHVDLTAYGGPADAAVWDGEIQELTAGGTRVWSWNAKDHISLAEAEHWNYGEYTLRDGTRAYDYFHLNSIEPDGDGVVISARHVDAVYRIDRATGSVDWKLGGSPRPESLKVIGDSYAEPFVGQHDARLQPDGTLTVYDNHTFTNIPRAVHFRIDRDARTATFLGQATDPKVQFSPAEGSARLLPGGDWVIAWGGARFLSEISSANSLVWRLRLFQAFDYRVQPIPFGRVPAYRLRRAMDRMHPRSP
jgi:Arylsulfotransferase (ASST)